MYAQPPRAPEHANLRAGLEVIGKAATCKPRDVAQRRETRIGLTSSPQVDQATIAPFTPRPHASIFPAHPHRQLSLVHTCSSCSLGVVLPGGARTRTIVHVPPGRASAAPKKGPPTAWPVNLPARLLGGSPRCTAVRLSLSIMCRLGQARCKQERRSTPDRGSATQDAHGSLWHIGTVVLRQTRQWQWNIADQDQAMWRAITGWTSSSVSSITKKQQ